MLDTFHDQRRAFVFESNPLGIQADALYSEQTGFDFSFNTVWDTWGARTSNGYAVLMRIPFASLYFAENAPGEMSTWGIILERTVSHTNESITGRGATTNIAGLLTQTKRWKASATSPTGRNSSSSPTRWRAACASWTR